MKSRGPVPCGFGSRRPHQPVARFQRLAGLPTARPSRASLAAGPTSHATLPALPSPGLKVRQRGRAPLNAALQYLPPEARSRLRQPGPLAAGVLVPEAAVANKAVRRPAPAGFLAAQQICKPLPRFFCEKS